MEAEPLSQCGDNEDLDPRIQHELDTLNKASVDINVLEKSLEEERQNYEKLFTGVTQNLNFLQAKLKSAIEKSRPYYDVKEKVKSAHGEVQSAAKRYDRAISTHQAAQQMVSVAEAGFQNSSRAAKSTLLESSTSTDEIDGSSSKERRSSRGVSSEVNTSGSFDLAWQEMLNVAVSKVYEAERELSISEAQHQTKMKTCVAIESQLKLLEKDLKGSIKKSRPYYEAKSISNFQLEEQLRRIKHLEGKIVESKQKYTAALCNLEAISEEIHFRRESKRGPRGQGVGAEATEDDSTQNKTETLSEETVLTFNKTSAEKFDQNGDSSNNRTPKPEKNLTDKPSSEREGPIGVDADFKTPLAASKPTLSEKLTASTESQTSLRSQYATLTPEDAKKLAKGETRINEFLNVDEDFGDADKFSNKIEADLKKLSTADLSSSFQNVSTDEFDADENEPSSSCVSTPVKLRRDVVDSGNSSRSSFSTTDPLPSAVSITTSSASSSLHSKSKSDEFLYQQNTSN